ncbi:MAG: gamma-glutamyl-gamma-aminobutyrate hydrolase family protein [Acidobacteriaceae bacterium]|nr:gamma-glutamyl-gamma-aminobutyrate hydrolase family protein [Acidobacteriaceae bacterium]
MNRRVLIPYRHEKKLKNYVDSLRAAGVEPIPVLASCTTELNGAAGLLLMGGTDVNPKLFGAAPDPATQTPDDERDAFELDLLDQALASDLPVFAICRGLQLLNVHSGGTLRQHLASPRHDPPEDADFAHQIEIEPDTLLSSIAGEPRWPVNSYHHQAADRVGAGLRVSARDAEDGTVEALEHSDRTFVLGVQWHPEDLAAGSPEQLRLFQHFAKRIHRA